MDLRRGDLERLKQELPRKAEIALRIIRWHAPLIRPEKSHAGKGRLPSPRALDSRIEELLRDAATGERHTVRAALPVSPVEFIHPGLGGGLGQLRRIPERKQFVFFH